MVWFFIFRTNYETRLIKEGDKVIKKIEQFRSLNNRLPESLTDIGIIVKDEGDPPFYYQKKDSVHYTISFGTILGESKVYHSDSKKWLDTF